MPDNPPPVTTVGILSEIGAGNASEATMAVRYHTCPPGPTFIPPLDKILLAARSHTGGSSLQRGDLIEVVGPSGSGKTVLCAFLLTTTLLPPFLTLPLEAPFHGVPSITVPLGGRGMRAALVSPANSRLVFLMDRGMRAHISSCISTTAETHGLHYDTRSPAAENAIDVVVSEALAHLTVLRPRPRALGWVLALRRLASPPEPVLGTTPPDGGLDLVVCDGFSDGFWPERWFHEDRGERHRDTTSVRGPEDIGMREVLAAITTLRKKLGAIIVLTVQGLRPIPNTPFFKPHLPPPYPSPFTQRYDTPEAPSAWPLNIQLTLLGPAKPLQFPAETTLVEALRTRKLPAVQVCDARVRVPGGTGQAGTMEGASWAFGVSEDGLVPFAE